MKDSTFKAISLSSIALWLGVFTLLPTLLIFMTSVLEYDSANLFRYTFTLDNFRTVTETPYLRVILRSLLIASSTTLICLILAYPFAYIISKIQGSTKWVLLLITIIPFWTSSLIRTYAIMALLKAKGVINGLFIAIGITHHPLPLLYNNFAVMVGLVYALLPFMILPLYSTFEKLDEQLVEAARDLGASKATIFRKIIFPLSLPGVVTGAILVFLPAMTLFYIPVLLGGAKSMLLGNLIENQYLQITNWPQGAATSIIFIMIMLVVMFLSRRYLTQRSQ